MPVSLFNLNSLTPLESPKQTASALLWVEKKSPVGLKVTTVLTLDRCVAAGLGRWLIPRC